MGGGEQQQVQHSAPGTGKTPRIFISYSHADRTEAQRIAEYLRTHGLAVRPDVGELRAGDSIAERIMDAIRTADVLLVVLSPAAVSSRWVAKELEVALARELEARDIVVVPVVIADCTVPDELGRA
jgi:hypothetical protein